jgi:hypothetical protein
MEVSPGLRERPPTEAKGPRNVGPLLRIHHSRKQTPAGVLERWSGGRVAPGVDELWRATRLSLCRIAHSSERSQSSPLSTPRKTDHLQRVSMFMNKFRKLGFRHVQRDIGGSQFLAERGAARQSSLQEALRLGRVSCDVVTIDQSGFSPRA